MTIDSALMPGSNTPRPPASQIQAWPGCQWRTSSFQATRIERTVVPARNARAASTAGACRECQLANRVTPLARACAARSSTSDSVAPGGFSRNTCLPASSAFTAAA